MEAGVPPGQVNVVTCAAPAYLQDHGEPQTPDDLRQLKTDELEQKLAVLRAHAKSFSVEGMRTGGPIITDKSKYLWNLDEDYFGG